MILISEDMSENTLSPRISLNSVYQSKGVKLHTRFFFLKNALTSLVLIISIQYLYLKWSSFNALSRELTNNSNLVTNQVSNYNFDIRPPQNQAIWPAKNLNLLQMTNFWLLHLIELSLINKTGYKTILVALSGAHNTPNTAPRSYLPNLHKKSFPTKISLP